MQVQLKVNGKRVTVDVAAQHAAGAGAARAPPADRHPRRLRHRPVRRLHRASSNGRAVKSCNMLAAQAGGAEITTIEGLAQPDGTMHPMQAAFKECHGLQCGFCTPGHGDERDRPVPAPPERQRGRNPRAARRQHLPLHRLPEHRQGRAAGRCGHGRSRRFTSPNYAKEYRTWVHPTFASLPHIGESVRRKEDYRFLTGAGQYTDDINLAQPELCRVRALAACARHASSRIDIAARRGHARRGRHLHRQGRRGQDGRPALRLADHQHRRHADERAAAPDPGDQGKVRYVGDHVAMVVAETLEQAQERGRSGGGRLRRAARRGRACADAAKGDGALHDGGARQPVLQVGARRQGGGRRRLRQRRACHQAGPGQQPADSQRDGAARGHRLYNRATDEYALYVSNQNPHVERLLMTAFVLGLPEHKVRVIAPDVGGGFGSKIYLYAEDVCLTWAAKQLNRSIKWTAERNESFPVRRPWPRPREPRRNGDGQGRQVPRAARAHRRQPGRLPVDLLDRDADHPVRARCWPANTPRRRSTSRSMPGSPTPRRSMPTAAPAGPRPPTCWSGW